jgi:hypothetical protein
MSALHSIPREEASPPTRLVPDHPALWRGSDLARTRLPGVSSGSQALDRELPGGGWPLGALTEILPQHEGIGELRLLGQALSALSRKNQYLIWVAPPYAPYAPALAAAGIDMRYLTIVRTRSRKDALWALEQALASNACGAVLGWLPESGGDRYTELRRLQLAAERGQALAFLFRSAACEREASPAALRIAVCAHRGGLAVRIFKRRGGALASPVYLSGTLSVEYMSAADEKPSSGESAGVTRETASNSAKRTNLFLKAY